MTDTSLDSTLDSNPKAETATPKTITKEFVDNTTLHVVPQAFVLRFKCLRVLWVVIFLGLTALLGFHMSGLVKNYYDYPTQVNALPCPAVLL